MIVLLSLFFSFLKVGFVGFGGGYAMLALMEQEIVKTQSWMTNSEFIDIIAVAEMTPGPIATNSATFVGFNVAGFLGAVIATLGVITPSLILILPAAALFSRHYQSPLIQGVLTGIYPAVIALIGLAVFVIAEGAIIDIKTFLIGIICFLLLLLTRIHPLLLLGLGALMGVLAF